MLKFNAVTFLFYVLLAVTLVLDRYFISLPGWIYGVVTCVYLGAVTYGTIVLSAGFFVNVKYSGSSGSNSIALTFDDGPIPGNTEKVLAILKSYQAQAAFFCIGHRIAEQPEIVQAIHAGGHIVGNHSYWHRSTFDLQSTAAIENELTLTNHAIHQAIGETPRFFRPPYGVTNPMVAGAIRRGNFETIGWSVRSFDTISQDAGKLFNRVTRNLKAGDVVLFHDYCDITLSVLPQFLEYVRRSGLKIARIDELLNEKAYATR